MLKQIGKFFKSTIFICNIIAIFVLFLSALSGKVSPNAFMPFAYLGLAFPFILFINIFFAIWWLFTRQWKFLVVCLVSLVICSGAIFAYFPMHAKTKEIPEDCIKVLSYNVMRFNQYKKHTEKKPSDLIQYILDSDADIVCLQEYGSHESTTLMTERDIENIFRRKYPYRKYFNITEEPKEKGGNVIFSKFPILSSKKIPYDSEYNGSFAVELNIKGKTVMVINNHLESNGLTIEDRNTYVEALRDMKELEFNKMEKMGKIMKLRFASSYRIRARQADAVSEWVKKTKTPYIIVCGDFNDTPISYTRYKIMGNLLKDSYAETGRGVGITYNKNKFWFRIDYILHSKNIKAYNCTVGKIDDSDHYPIQTYLKLN